MKLNQRIGRQSLLTSTKYLQYNLGIYHRSANEHSCHLIAERVKDTNLVTNGRRNEAIESAAGWRAVALIVLHQGQIHPQLELVDETPIQAWNQLG